LSRAESADEYLLMGLRLAEGIDLDRFEILAGRPLPAEQIAYLAQHGLVETPRAGRLRVTAAGFPVLDAVVADLAAYCSIDSMLSNPTHSRCASQWRRIGRTFLHFG